MAREPLIEVEGHAFDVKRFQDGGTVINVCVTPARFDKQQNQWVDLETIYFDVSVHADNQRLQAVAGEIEYWLQGGDSVQVFVAGKLTETKGSKGGTFKRIYPTRFYVLGHKPKGGGQLGGFTGAQQARTQQPSMGQPATDPWSNQPNEQYEF